MSKNTKPLFSAKWAEVDNEFDEDEIIKELAKNPTPKKNINKFENKKTPISNSNKEKNSQNQKFNNFANFNSKPPSKDHTYENDYFHKLKANFRSNLNKLTKNNNLYSLKNDKKLNQNNNNSMPAFDFSTINQNRLRVNAQIRENSNPSIPKVVNKNEIPKVDNKNQVPKVDSVNFELFLKHFLNLENHIKVLEKKLASILKKQENSKLSFKKIALKQKSSFFKMTLSLKVKNNLKDFDYSFENNSFYSFLIYNLNLILNKFPWLNNHFKTRNFINQNIINLGCFETSKKFFVLNKVNSLKVEEIKNKIISKSKKKLTFDLFNKTKNNFTMVLSHEKRINHQHYENLFSIVSLIINIHKNRKIDNEVVLDFYIDSNVSNKNYLKTFGEELKKYIIK